MMRGPLDHHRELLRARAVSDETIIARGYWSAETRASLRDLGFAPFQQLPGLVIPVRDARGGLTNYQSRPDTPRIDAKRGRPVKYETVAGSRMTLDVPPASRLALADPARALWLTEGPIKADALVSAGAVACGLLGVWAWRGTNGDGGTTALPDWELIALNGRRVFLAFDSDVMTKAGVHAALDRLSRFLAARGAVVAVVYLPPGDGGKQGCDDYLAAGHTLADMRALAEDGLRPLPATEPERDAPLPTAQLLAAVEGLLTRHVRLPGEHELTALALWTLHTWALDAASVTPYLWVTSPAKRSGKTRLLEVLELAVREPVRAAGITPAALFQSIAAFRPTLLVDEVDAVFSGARASERTEELRGVLNAGNARGSFVLRGTQDGTPAKFPIFCPKCIAGINNGRLPDTVVDRAIKIRLERKRADEPVERLRPTELDGAVTELCGRLDDWSAAHTGRLATFRGDAILEIGDRLDEAWEPLRAIAELAGGVWPARARAAAVALAGHDTDDSDLGTQLLAALRALLGPRTTITSQDACTGLNKDEQLPFGALRGGEGIDPRGLARLLKPYGIRPRVVRAGAETPRGYHRDQFADAWERYLGHTHATPPPKEAQQAQQAQHRRPHAGPDVADVADVADQGEGEPRARVSTFPGRQPEPIPGQLSFSQNGAAPARQLAGVDDDGLLAAFPGATVERLDEWTPPDKPIEATWVDPGTLEPVWTEDDRLLSSADAAKAAGVSPAALAARVRKGELIPRVDAGAGKRFYTVGSLRELWPEVEPPPPRDPLDASSRARADRYRRGWPWLEG